MQKHAKAGIPISQENYTTVFISFKELSPRRTTYPELFERFSSGELRQATEKIQAFPYGSESYKIAKRTYLPFFSPHCQTRGLKKNDTIQHSGVFCFDIDKKDNPALDFEKLKEILRREHSVLGYFTSVGGGLKVFVRVRSNFESHQRDYFHVLGWIEKLSGASFDKSQGGLSQICFLSYDPDAYYNRRAKTLNLEGKTHKRVTVSKTIKEHQIHALRDEASLIRIFYQLERKGRSITETYDEWIKLGFALINTLEAEKAKEWFHRFSSLDSSYTFEETEEKYESLQKSSLSYRGKGKLSMATILYRAKQQGCIGEVKPTSPFNLNHAHPLQFAMPSRYSSTQVLQAKIVYTIAWLENNPRSTHKHAGYVRINQKFIAGIVGSSQQSISNNIRKLKDSGFMELIQPRIGEGDSSYFAKTTKKYYQALLASSKLKNMQILENEGLQESCLNEPTGGEGECKGGTKLNFLPKKEKRRKEQEVQRKKSLENEIFSQGSCSSARTFPNKDEKNGDGSYPSPHAQGRGEGQLFLKPMPAKIREDYQHFQDELQKLSGYRKDSKQIQQEFVRVYDKKASIFQYLPSFLKKEPGKDVFWYLHDRKWIQYAKLRRKIPLPKNAAEARSLNDRYKIADLVRKHRHLDCIILDGKNKFPEKVPEGIPYMLGPGRYYLNEEGVRRGWDPKTESSE